MTPSGPIFYKITWLLSYQSSNLQTRCSYKTHHIYSNLHEYSCRIFKTKTRPKLTRKRSVAGDGEGWRRRSAIFILTSHRGGRFAAVGISAIQPGIWLSCPSGAVPLGLFGRLLSPEFTVFAHRHINRTIIIFVVTALGVAQMSSGGNARTATVAETCIKLKEKTVSDKWSLQLSYSVKILAV